MGWVAEADMMGRRVAVLCNLKPAKMRGIMSHGMVRNMHVMCERAAATGPTCEDMIVLWGCLLLLSTRV